MGALAEQDLKSGRKTEGAASWYPMLHKGLYVCRPQFILLIFQMARIICYQERRRCTIREQLLWHMALNSLSF